MDLGRLIDDVTKDWEWLSFLARYCAGRNFGQAFCQDVRWWAIGIAGLLVVIAVWWILARLVKAYENWNFRRLSAEIADAETMKRHVWSGHDAHAADPTSAPERKGQRPR